MAAIGVVRGQIQVRQALPSAGIVMRVEIVVAAGSIEGDEVGLVAERS